MNDRATLQQIEVSLPVLTQEEGRLFFEGAGAFLYNAGIRDKEAHSLWNNFNMLTMAELVEINTLSMFSEGETQTLTIRLPEMSGLDMECIKEHTEMLFNEHNVSGEAREAARFVFQGFYAFILADTKEPCPFFPENESETAEESRPTGANLTDLMATALREMPMKPDELAQVVLERGYETRSKKFGNVVRCTLSASSLFRPVGDGRWALTDSGQET